MKVPIFIALIMLMRVLQSLYSKKAAMILPDGIRPYISYVAVSKLFAAGFAFASIVFDMRFSGINAQTILIASCSGISLSLGSFCSVKALTSGTIALNSIFSTAGMILPIILSAVFFDESITVVQCICIAVLLAALAMVISASRDMTQGFSVKSLMYLFGSFFTNGMVAFFQKLFGHLQPEGNVSMFSLLTFLIPATMMEIVLLCIKPQKDQTKEKAKLPKRILLYATILAFAVFIIQQFVTILTPIMSSAVLFTWVNGGATIIAAIVGWAVYKEKLTVKSGIGMALGIAAMVFIKTGI